MTKIIVTISVSCFLLFQPEMHGQTAGVANGGISGTLKTEDGTPVDALIRIGRPSSPTGLGVTSPLPALPTVAVNLAASNTSGAFQATSLPPGTYEICATVLAGGYTDPCLWETSGTLVTVAAGQTATATITLKKAATLRVHITDTANLISDSPQGAIVLAALYAGRYYPLVKKNQDSSGRDYEIAVPFDRDVRFTIRPMGLTVVDSNNVNVTNGQVLSATYSSSGSAPAVLNYRVTGRR